jgi:hypothetical protein
VSEGRANDSERSEGFDRAVVTDEWEVVKEFSDLLDELSLLYVIRRSEEGWRLAFDGDDFLRSLEEDPAVILRS